MPEARSFGEELGEELNLTSPSVVRSLVESLGLSPKRSRGQNFLVSRAVLERIVARAELSPEDVVLEVGPGLGVLTRELLTRVRAVVAVELEPAFAELLPRTLEGAAASLAVVLGDAAHLEPSMLASALGELGCVSGPTKLVANLPYSVAATVLFRAFERLGSLVRATVMVQREVADRIAARPSTKDYGAYTVKLALHSRVVNRFEVARESFWPAPHVDSAVVTLERGERADAEALSRVSTLVDAAFAQRRKTLANNLFAAGIPREAVEGALTRLSLDPRVRAEALAPTQFLELSELLPIDLTEDGRLRCV